MGVSVSSPDCTSQTWLLHTLLAWQADVQLVAAALHLQRLLLQPDEQLHLAAGFPERPLLKSLAASRALSTLSPFQLSRDNSHSPLYNFNSSACMQLPQTLEEHRTLTVLPLQTSTAIPGSRHAYVSP